MSPVPSRDQKRGEPLSFEQLLGKVREGFPTAKSGTAPNGARWISVEAAILLEVARFLKNEPSLAFDSLCCLTGVDLLRFPPPAEADGPASDQLVCAYDLHSLRHDHELRLKVSVPPELAVVPSVESVWGVANFFEREIYDLFGIEFRGHHDLRRLLMPPDWVGHPMRKDYAYPAAYGDWELKREGQTFESGPYK